MDDERPPICPACGVTMVPAALSARDTAADEWVCLECEAAGEPDRDGREGFARSYAVRLT
jgi:hypothetical protein